jgi:indole-3-glycerol phosphate synthase
VDLGMTERLAPQVPDDILVVSESGLGGRSDLQRMADAGVTTFLIGESLMRETDVAAATSSLLTREAAVA